MDKYNKYHFRILLDGESDWQSFYITKLQKDPFFDIDIDVDYVITDLMCARMIRSEGEEADYINPQYIKRIFVADIQEIEK